jgi:hypothetical protein
VVSPAAEQSRVYGRPLRLVVVLAHTLTVYALDAGVTLDRFEIAFTGAPRADGPVPETRITP